MATALSRHLPGPTRFRLDPRLALALALALPATLYLATLFPGIGDRAASGDAIEFQTVGRVLGVAHEPGYPQYVLLGFLWSWLPLPLTVATKINLLSAVLALAAGGFLFATARQLGAHPLAATLACWALLTAPDVWRLATQAEVYTLHALWVSAFFWAGLRWWRDGSRGALITLLFVYALSFGNHLTMITLLPALIFLLVTRQPHLVADARAWGWALAAAGTGAAQYLLLLWRSYRPHPTLLERFPLQAGVADLFAYITGSRFIDKHWLAEDGVSWGSRLGEALKHGSEQLTPVLAVLALAGVVTGWRRYPTRFGFLLLAIVSVLFFAAAYDIRDWLLYAIPAWIAFALLGAEAMTRLLELRPRWGILAVAAVAAILAWRIVDTGHTLRVASNPADLTRVLPQLPDGSRILPAGGRRLSRLHEDYYLHAESLERRGRRFLSTRQDYLGRGLHLRERPFYFRHPVVAKILRGRLVDFRPWPGWQGPDGSVFVTGTDEPLTKLTLRGLAGPALELGVRDQVRVLDTRLDDLYLFFVGRRNGQAKGLEGFSPEKRADVKRARQLLAELPDGDLAVLLTAHFDEPILTFLRSTRETAGLPWPQASAVPLIVAWRKGGDTERAFVWPAPAEGEKRELVLAGL